jgi:hypothetical protein
MSMQTAAAQLTKTTKVLNYQWSRANEHWDDPVSRRIEEKHIQPLIEMVHSAIGAMETMSEAITRAKHECS